MSDEFSYQEIMVAQSQRIQQAHAQAVADLESGRADGDAWRVTDAADRILQLDAQHNALAQRANQWATHQPQQANKFGLSADEVVIANGLASGDRRLTNEDRQRTYAENKQRLAHMRATGQYRDDQGTVRR